jgi:hypothetical protein
MFLVSLLLKEGKSGLLGSSSSLDELKCIVHVIFRLELRIENVFHAAVLADN